jgi:hypothetical protein
MNGVPASKHPMKPSAQRKYTGHILAVISIMSLEGLKCLNKYKMTPRA